MAFRCQTRHLIPVASEPSPLGTTKQLRMHKRPRQDEDDDLGNNLNCNQGNYSGLWACPFYKLDPCTHYRCIEKHKLRRFSDIKQHIRRCHVLPENAFLKLECDEKGPSHGREQQKWYQMWENLFGGHSRPSSPYVEDGIAEPIALIRSRAEPLLAAVLPSLLQDCINIQADADAVLRLGHEILRIIFEATLAPQQQASSNTTADIAAVATVGDVVGPNPPSTVPEAALDASSSPLHPTPSGCLAGTVHNSPGQLRTLHYNGVPAESLSMLSPLHDSLAQDPCWNFEHAGFGSDTSGTFPWFDNSDNFRLLNEDDNFKFSFST